MPEQQLMPLVQALRERRATQQEVEAIYFAHMRLAIAIACRFSASMGYLIQDIVSEAMLGLAEALYRAPNVMVDNNITPYISTTVVGKVIDFVENQYIMRGRTFRHKKKSDPTTASPQMDLLTKAHERIGVQQSRVDEILELIEACVKKDRNLKRREYKRAVIRLKAAGYEYQEIAEILDISKRHVNKMLAEVYEEYEKLERELAR